MFGRAGLTARFAVVAGVLLSVIALGISHVLAGLIGERARTQAEQTAVLAVGLGVVPHLHPSRMRGPVDDRTSRALDAALAGSRGDFAADALDNRVLRVKVFDATATVIYSDLPGLTGRRFDSPDVRRALRGTLLSQVTNLQDSDERVDAGLGTALEVYVPLTFGRPRPVGVAEVYLPYSPVERAVRHDTRVLYVSVAGSLLLLFLSLFQMVSRASRRLRSQTAELQAGAALNEYLAQHDPLTSLPNRSLLNDRLALALATARRRGTGVAVLLIDLDRFKDINDTLGHDAGDSLLCLVGARVSATLREVDTVARLGGDEFVVLLPDAGVDEAVLVAQRLLAELHRSFVVEGLELAVEASIGIACHPLHGLTPGELLQHADVAMYAAKDSRGTHAVYDLSSDQSTMGRITLLNDLRRALDEEELVLHYQPKVDLGDGTIRSVEALIRWQHPDRGIIGPGAFMPMAEQTGLIGPITTFVVAEALRQVRQWSRAGLDLRVSVNLSMRNLADTSLPDQVERQLRQAGVPPERLDVEITESSAMGDPVRALEVLQGLAALGVGVAVDDYGTGYSSLSYLRSLPVDTLKIDKSFVSTMLADEGSAVIVSSTIELAHSLGLSAVAEGVEDAGTYAALARLGCDTVQGFHISRPVTGDAIEALVAVTRGAGGPSRPGSDREGRRAPGYSAAT